MTNINSLIKTAPIVPIAPIEINIDEQKLYYFPNFPQTTNKLIFSVSTSKNGLGEKINSYKTPRGLMQIRAKIGEGAHPLAVFKRRRRSGEICNSEVFQNSQAGKDWILGRILWLSGLEPFYNRSGEVDTMRRFIYIHGTPEATDINKPGSIGCVRMFGDELISLFNLVQPHTQIYIRENSANFFDVICGHWQNIGKMCSQVRTEVFVNEQNVPPEIEYDSFDNLPQTIHILILNRQGQAVAAGRLTFNQSIAKLGRMAVLKPYRKLKLGRELIKKAINIATNKKCQEIYLHSQKYAVGFYQKSGFNVVGEEFVEADIVHQKMTYSL